MSPEDAGWRRQGWLGVRWAVAETHGKVDIETQSQYSRRSIAQLQATEVPPLEGIRNLLRIFNMTLEVSADRSR